MTSQVFIAGDIPKDFASMHVFIAGNVEKEVASAWIMTDEGLKLFYLKAGEPAPPPDPTPPSPPPPEPIVLSITITPNNSPSSVAPAHASVATTSPVGAIVSNGTAPYSYSWELLDWDAGSFPAPTISSPSTQYTPFQQSGMTAYTVSYASFRVTATDANGNTGYADVYATFYRNA